jgi:hypothetical protein
VFFEGVVPKHLLPIRSKKKENLTPSGLIDKVILDKVRVNYLEYKS